MMISKATERNSARVSGTFKLVAPRHAGTKHWLHVWDQNRGDSGSWRPVMPIDSLAAVMHWEDLIRMKTGGSV